MAKIELDEEEILRLRRVEKTVGDMFKHPKAKLLLQEAHKTVDPNAITPDLDAQKPLDDRFKQLSDQNAALAKQISDDKAEREQRDAQLALKSRVDGGIDRLRSQGWTEEGIKGVQDIMEKNGILDPEIAASHFEKLHPPQMPISPTNGTGAWNFLDVPADGAEADLKKLIENRGEGLIVDKLANDALREVRGAVTQRR